jgi:hypothetical protein
MAVKTIYEESFLNFDKFQTLIRKIMCLKINSKLQKLIITYILSKYLGNLIGYKK